MVQILKIPHFSLCRKKPNQPTDKGNNIIKLSNGPVLFQLNDIYVHICMYVCFVCALSPNTNCLFMWIKQHVLYHILCKHLTALQVKHHIILDNGINKIKMHFSPENQAQQNINSFAIIITSINKLLLLIIHVFSLLWF